MSIGSRIKKIRKELDLTQTEFANRIGSVQNTVTGYENGRRNPSSPIISLICKEFNVREEWLRTGEGEMFQPNPSDVLDRLAQEYQLSNASYVMIEKFISLPPEVRDKVFNFFREVCATVQSGENDPSVSAFSENTSAYPPDRMIENEQKPPSETDGSVQKQIDREVADFRRQLELEARRTGKLSVSNDTDAGTDLRNKKEA